MSVSVIHSRTIELLGSKSAEIKSVFEADTDLRQEPAYFAPFLKRNMKRWSVSQPLLELASLEWTVFSTQNMAGSWAPNSSSSEYLRKNPSLVILPVQYDVLGMLTGNLTLESAEASPKNLFLAVFLKPSERQVTVFYMKSAWLSILDILDEGARKRADIINELDRRAADQNLLPSFENEQNQIDELITLHLIEPA